MIEWIVCLGIWWCRNINWCDFCIKRKAKVLSQVLCSLHFLSYSLSHSLSTEVKELSGNCLWWRCEQGDEIYGEYIIRAILRDSPWPHLAQVITKRSSSAQPDRNTMLCLCFTTVHICFHYLLFLDLYQWTVYIIFHILSILLGNMARAYSSTVLDCLKE